MGKKRKRRKRRRGKPFLYVREVKHGWVSREIHLSGEVEVVIAYDCWGEFLGTRRSTPSDLPVFTQGLVRVDGVEIGLLSPGWAPQGRGAMVGFELRSGEDAFPAEVRAELSVLGLRAIRWLALVVAGMTLYEERDGETVLLQARSDLPVPAARGDAAGEGLPIPGEAGEGEY